MSEPTYRVKHDVFVLFLDCDAKVASYVVKGLEGEKLNCVSQWNSDTVNLGQPEGYNDVEYMRKSNITLLILTEDSLAKCWATSKTILAVMRSLQRGELTLRLLLCGVKETEIGFLKKGLLQDIPDITVDFNKQKWAITLADRLKEPMVLPKLLPIGCLAHGQVFSHFVGFLRYLLPKLDEIIESTEVYKRDPDNVSKKLLMLLPGSCELPDNLNTEDSELGITISTEAILEFEAHHAGKQRTINPPLYKVTKGMKVYYFIADLPNVLKTMFSMKSKDLAKVDIRLQIARFYYTVNEVLNHKKNHGCADKVTLVPYNDKTECIADVVFQAVEEDIICQKTENAMRGFTRTPQRLLSGDRHDYENDVLIVVGDNVKDCGYANEIKVFLEKAEKRVALQRPGRSEFDGLDKARWVVFIISQISLSENELMLLKCVSVLTDSADGNMLRALPVLVDLEPQDLPPLVSWVTLVSVTEPRYREKLLQTVNGGNITLEQRLPSGDVVTGLAWAYVLNYLTLTVLGRTQTNRDFSERIQDLLSAKAVSCGCIRKLFVLVPRSCFAQPDIVAEANKGCAPGTKPPLQKIGILEPIIHNKRTYKFHMYQYTDHQTGKSVCFVSEYSTPINCMHEMANAYAFAGLHKAEMHKQAEEFVQLFPSIVNRQAVKDRAGDVSDLVQLIFFNDEKESLLSALQKQIKFDNVDDDDDLVFADRPGPVAQKL